ncbi:MAG: hypothetical protein QN193_09135 [Armatimonadota bacterium]|nr:hypothetical protein [Armatimonadota bacterium]MDR7444400.1 hypothetical protein [Armatimonadota bacterium]MDR7570756.1 hypothetical protein [Armatimonadota bacterium]MDR7614886.1 hypothetical protein [Armatimonadota bacterium]
MTAPVRSVRRGLDLWSLWCDDRRGVRFKVGLIGLLFALGLLLERWL